MLYIDPDGPLGKLSRDTVHSLVKQAKLYIDPTTRDYRSTPPQREGGMSGAGYVSGRDVEEWPGRLDRFRTKWEPRPQDVRDAILALAHPRKCFWINPAQDPRKHNGYVPSEVVENEAGHTPFDGDPETFKSAWTWGDTLEKAQTICAEFNTETYGLTPEETQAIVLSSLRASRSPEHRL